MAVFDRRKREVLIKLVYYGPGLVGKTTNLSYVFERTDPGVRSPLLPHATENTRTISFDFRPKSLGPIDGYAIRFQLMTTPSPLFYDESRRFALKGADGVVFVADSQVERTAANAESLQNLNEYLASHGTRIGETPLVVQYNKRDLPNAAPVSELSRLLNPLHVPELEATARLGEGVFDTLKAIAKAAIVRVGPSSSAPGGGGSDRRG